MVNLYTQAESNIRKTWLYLSFFFVLVIALGWVVSYYFESPGILYFAVITSFFMNFIAYWSSDKIVLSISGAKEIEKKDNPELYRIVENLCITAGLPTPKVYIIDSLQPNAFATGRNAEHAVVAVTRGLLEKLDKAELEGVLAHELSHIGNKDMLLQTVVVVLVGFVVMLSDFFLRINLRKNIGRRESKEGQAGAILMVISLIFIVLSPILAQLMKMAISRKREFLADSSGALLTRYPEGLAKALEKISQDTNVLKSANDAMAHLYIANPFKEEKKSWAHSLFSTHPPVEERVKVLRGMQL
jgi:heat shock protein HtpX